jgi:hypothetical protein
LLIVLLSSLTAASQKQETRELLWTCPMHPDVLESEMGRCPVCKMNLAPVRLGYVWSCPVHSVIDRERPGNCPICKRDLVQTTVAVSWTCADNPKEEKLNPGKCADGTDAVEKHTLRPHGNHSPQHGGSFFMASDNWHHLEGTHPEAGLFRLHLYDDYSKPLRPNDMKQASGTLTRKSETVPFKLAGDGKSLEARLTGLAPPAELIAKVRFKANGPEYRFDFVFREYSKEPAPVAPALSGTAGATLKAREVPARPVSVLEVLKARVDEIHDLIERGAYGEIYVPAFQAKDLALSLDQRAAEMTPQKRTAVTVAVEQVVRSAWQLDAYGDLGDRERINGAYAVFAAAVKELEAAFSR